MTNFQVYILAFAISIPNAIIVGLMMAYMAAKFETVTVRFNAVDQRFVSLEKLIDQRFESLEREIHNIREGR